MAEAVESGVNTMAEIKHMVPMISPMARVRTGAASMSRSNRARFCASTTKAKTAEPPMPSITRIWPTGRALPIILINASSIAKPSIASTIMVAPRRLSM